MDTRHSYRFTFIDPITNQTYELHTIPQPDLLTAIKFLYGRNKDLNQLHLVEVKEMED